MSFTPFNGNSCKSPLYLNKTDNFTNIAFIFMKNSWRWQRSVPLRGELTWFLLSGLEPPSSSTLELWAWPFWQARCRAVFPAWNRMDRQGSEGQKSSHIRAHNVSWAAATTAPCSWRGHWRRPSPAAWRTGWSRARTPRAAQCCHPAHRKWQSAGYLLPLC